MCTYTPVGHSPVSGICLSSASFFLLSFVGYPTCNLFSSILQLSLFSSGDSVLMIHLDSLLFSLAKKPEASTLSFTSGCRELTSPGQPSSTCPHPAGQWETLSHQLLSPGVSHIWISLEFLWPYGNTISVMLCKYLAAPLSAPRESPGPHCVPAAGLAIFLPDSLPWPQLTGPKQHLISTWANEAILQLYFLTGTEKKTITFLVMGWIVLRICYLISSNLWIF